MNELIFYPDLRLNQISNSVEEFNEDLKSTAALLETLLFKHRARGIAAIQIAKPISMFALLLEEDQPKTFCNPKIIEYRGKKQTSAEGCLSIPGVLGKIQRYPEIVIWANNIEGGEIILQLKDTSAVAFQHELDHTIGKTMFNRMGTAQRTLKRTQYLKQRRKKNG